MANDIPLISRCNEMCIDSLKYVFVYFDEGSEKYLCYYKTAEIRDSKYYFADEDSLCKRIMNSFYGQQQKQEEEILPCIMEKIKDTAFATTMYEDAYVYTVSDIAIDITTYILENRYGFRVRDFFKRDFAQNSGMYEQLHYRIFIGNSPERNYKNRVKYYNTVKKFYDKNKNNNR
jgi:hypothetical protein